MASRRVWGTLAVGQILLIGVLVAGRPGSERVQPLLRPGVQVNELRSTDITGRTSTPLVRGDGLPTVVLAFRSTCKYCVKTTPLWNTWLEGEHNAAVVAISDEPLDSAQAYAAAHGWTIPVASVAALPDSSRERAVTGKTPWIYIFDSAGTLVSERHGATIHTVDSIITSIKTGEL